MQSFTPTFIGRLILLCAQFWSLVGLGLIHVAPTGVKCFDFELESHFPVAETKEFATRYQSYWLKNHKKYFQALKIFHEKLMQRTAEVELRLPVDPWTTLDTPCDRGLWERLIGDYLITGESAEIFSNRLAEHPIQGSCLSLGALPVLECDSTSLTCVCLNATKTPFDFILNNNTAVTPFKQCLGQAGTICDGDLRADRGGSVNCGELIECNTEMGICGGGLALMEDTFSGQEVMFTAYELEQAAESDDQFDNLVIDFQLRDTIPIGTPCDFDTWSRIVSPYQKAISSIMSDMGFHVAVKDVESSLSPSETAFRDELFNNASRGTQRCIDRFPSMLCTKGKKHMEPATCTCGHIPPYFNYTAVEGTCAATEGSVCTSVHGPVFCLEDADTNSSCMAYKVDHSSVKHSEFASVLTVFDFKICGEASRLRNRSSGKVTKHKKDSNEAQHAFQTGYLGVLIILSLCVR